MYVHTCIKKLVNLNPWIFKLDKHGNIDHDLKPPVTLDLDLPYAT